MESRKVYGFEMIRVEDIGKILDKEPAILVDLRSEENYRKGHMKNAKNFPITYIDEWKREIPDKISLILYCEHGNQSLLAARKLKERKGNVYTVVGGYQAFLKSTDNIMDNVPWKKD